jgi:hypothetical protein
MQADSVMDCASSCLKVRQLARAYLAYRYLRMACKRAGVTSNAHSDVGFAGVAAKRISVVVQPERQEPMEALNRDGGPVDLS